MNRRIAAVALLTLVLLAGCGNPAKQQEEAGSFAISTEPESEFEVPNKSETSPVSAAAAAKVVISASTNKISWSQFFDNEDQNTPSEHFWDLSGSKVEINGYMGEVLSFEKNWFLLIPKPGAECPFDNGDETYWNKIMIVFVPDDVNLRHHTGPLKISGKLDVGIKIDESGYKTMFRLYDAAFEEIKE